MNGILSFSKKVRGIVSKTFASFVLLPVLLQASPVLAAGPSMNTHSQDHPTISVGKTGQSWEQSVAATSGEEINVFVWIHNNSQNLDENIAKNVVAKVVMPQGLNTSHVLNASVKADNSNTALGSATITTVQPTSISYIPGSAKILQNTDEKLTPTEWPAGTNPDDIVSANGVKLGDQRGCWEFSRAITFKVKVQEVAPTLEVIKQVRRAGTTEPFVDRLVGLQPGTKLEYKIVVKNKKEQSIVRDLRLQDMLPAGITYVGPTTVRKPDGTTTEIAEGIAKDGLIILPELAFNQTAEVTFIAAASQDFKNDACAVNKVVATASNISGQVEDTAETCFVVVVAKVTPTPTPTPKPSPTPSPVVTVTPQPTTPVTPALPKTGAAAVALLLPLGITAYGLAASKYLKSKEELKHQARNIDIL